MQHTIANRQSPIANRQGQRGRVLLPFDFCLLTFAFPFLTLRWATRFRFSANSLLFLRLLPSACCFLLSAPGFAQTPSSTTYAAIDRAAVGYSGPGRDAEHDLRGPEIRLGLLAPLTGPRQAEGEALRRAAEMAVEEENAASLRAGGRLVIATRDESGAWGRASSEIARLLFDDNAVALLTSSDGGAAHVAEQVATKIGVPILTLSSDDTTTEINLPWIFRIGPTDEAQAHAIARDIYGTRKLQRVILLTQEDHDGRLGGAEFLRAARAISAPAPIQMNAAAHENSASHDIGKELDSAQAVVIWADTATAGELIPRVREASASVPIYVCRKAAEAEQTAIAEAHRPACNNDGGGVWTTEALNAASKQHANFVQHYRQRFGADPGMGAAEAYDAVHLLAAAIRQSGPNRARLRDALADVKMFPGASGTIAFDHAGNDLTPIALVRVN
jgi:branched-chain amino acid transport system substrate-binding protein